MPEKKKSFGQTLCNSKELSRSMENVEVMGVEERDENFEIVEEFLAEENLDSVVGDEFTEVLGERGLMLDAFALLGGNENLVQQLINRLVDTDYS